MHSPLITIIIPAYNAEKYLDKCLSSVCSQTYRNLEIVLINDGSTDNTGIKCDEWQEKDDRIKVIHQTNHGLSEVCNIGVRVASGKMIGFVDSDDWIAETMFEEMHASIIAHGSDISVCGVLDVSVDGEILNHISLTSQPMVLETKKALLYLLIDKSERSFRCNKLFKKELFDGIKFPASHVFEDFSTVHKLYAKANKISYTNSYTYYYMNRDNSLGKEQSPKTIYDFFIANYERYRFIQSYPHFTKSEKRALLLRNEQRLLRSDRNIHKVSEQDEFLHEKKTIRELIKKISGVNYSYKMFGIYMWANYIKSAYYYKLYTRLK